MKIHLLAASLVIFSLLAQPCDVFAKKQSSGPGENWATVQSVPVAAALDVTLKDGKSQKGRFVSASDSELVLSSGKDFKSLGRDQIKRVRMVVPNSRGNAAGNGAVFGSLLAFAGVNGLCDSSECIPPGAAMFSLAILGAGIGALIGLIVARPHKRILIYDAK